MRGVLLGVSVAAALQPLHLGRPVLSRALVPLRVRMSSGQDLSGLTIPQLKERLREVGLPVTGAKAELIERLADAPAAGTPEAVAAGLSGLTIPQLKERLREVGLPVTGAKAELIERLVVDAPGMCAPAAVSRDRGQYTETARPDSRAVHFTVQAEAIVQVEACRQ